MIQFLENTQVYLSKSKDKLEDIEKNHISADDLLKWVTSKIKVAELNKLSEEYGEIKNQIAHSLWDMAIKSWEIHKDLGVTVTLLDMALQITQIYEKFRKIILESKSKIYEWNNLQKDAKMSIFDLFAMFTSFKNFFRLKYWIRLVGFFGWLVPIQKLLGFKAITEFFENTFGNYGSEFLSFIIFIFLVLVGYFFKEIYREKIQGISDTENIEELNLKEWVYSKQNSYYIVGILLYIFAL